MTRSKKLCIMLAALLIVASGATAAVKMAQNSAETETGQTILAVDSEAVSSLSWTYNGEEMTFDRSDENWQYTEDAEFPLDEDYIQTMLSTLSEVVSYRTIEDSNDLEQYGLEEPVCQIEVSLSEENEEGQTETETVSLSIGSESSMGGRRYISIGDGNVYMVDSSVLDSFSYQLLDVVEKDEIPSMTETSGFTIETDEQTMDIDFMEESGLAYSDEYIWFLNEDGEYTALDTDLTYDLFDMTAAMAWDDCVDYKASENLGTYGLDDPATTVTVEYTDMVQTDTGETDEDGETVYETEKVEKTFVLEIGDYTGDYCYARVAGSDIVCLIDASIADAVMYADPEDLLPDEILAIDWDDVTGADISLDGTTYHFEKVEEEVTDDEGNTSEETVWEMDGEETDIQTVLDSLTEMASAGSEDDIDSRGEVQISFVFYQDSENFPEVTLDFYRYDSDSCLVSLNGEMRLLAPKDSVDTVIEDFNLLIAG